MIFAGCLHLCCWQNHAKALYINIYYAIELPPLFIQLIPCLAYEIPLNPIKSVLFTSHMPLIIRIPIINPLRSRIPWKSSLSNPLQKIWESLLNHHWIPFDSMKSSSNPRQIWMVAMRACARSRSVCALPSAGAPPQMPCRATKGEEGDFPFSCNGHISYTHLIFIYRIVQVCVYLYTFVA